MALSSPTSPWNSGPWVSGASLLLGLGLLSPTGVWAANSFTPALKTAPITLELAQVRLRLGARPVRYRLGAFRRGAACLGEGTELMPLTPAVTDQEAADEGLSLEASLPVDDTTRSHPAFFIYVPPLEEPTTAQFTLQTDPLDPAAVEELVSVRFPITQEGGIVGIYLPDTIAGLEVDHHYYWQMMVECNTEQLTENPVVSGWVHRVTPTATPTATASVAARVTFYAENGLWADALTLLATERYENPSDRDLTRLWQDLMVAAGLEAIAPEPLAQRVNLTRAAIPQSTP